MVKTKYFDSHLLFNSLDSQSNSAGALNNIQSVLYICVDIVWFIYNTGSTIQIHIDALALQVMLLRLFCKGGKCVPVYLVWQMCMFHGRLNA